MINIVVALPAEARSLIRAFNLKSSNTHSLFKVYTGEAITLVISGVGKINSAAACVYLYSITGESEHMAWLNVGIAGHAHSVVGEGFLATKITDVATSSSWYPSRLLTTGITADALITVDLPQNDYPDDSMCDMEASGFYAMASKMTTCELIQIYKVISDNRQHDAHEITASRVEQLIADRLPELSELMARLSTVCDELKAFNAEPDEIKEFIREWHFSVTQRHRLKRLIACCKLRSPDGSMNIASLMHLKNSREVLKHLEKHIERLPVCFPGRPAGADHIV